MDNLGGAQVHLLDLISKINKLDYNIILIHGGSLNFKIDKKVKCYNIPSLKRNISPIKDIRALFQLFILLRKLKPNLLLCHSSKAVLMGRLSQIFHSNFKVINTIHGWSFSPGTGNKVKRNLIFNLERIVDFFSRTNYIFVSEYDYNLSASFISNTRSIVIHNTAKVELIPKKIPKKESEKANTTLRLIMIARFDKQKNQKLLLQAISGLDNIELSFIGDGPLLEHCKVQVRSLGLQQRVNFLGFIDSAHKQLANYDALILISNYEGLPITILEAMKYGLPVIASNVGGNKEAVINDFNGYLVNNSINSIQEAIIKLNNRKTREIMSENTLKLFKEKFSEEHFFNKTFSYYKQILGTK